VLDSTIITAQKVKEALLESQLLNTCNQKASHEFYVSDFTPAFEQITKIFYGAEIHLAKCDIWNEA
jgi:glutamate racemase